MMADVYEPDRPEEWCCTCEHYEFDSWYPTERVCGCRYADRYGLIVDKTDTCGQWERRQE